MRVIESAARGACSVPGYLLPSVPLCTAPLAGSERPRPAGYERKVSGPVDPRAAARRRSSALRSSRESEGTSLDRCPLCRGACATGKRDDGRVCSCSVFVVLLCYSSLPPGSGQGTADETESACKHFLPFEQNHGDWKTADWVKYPLSVEAAGNLNW